MSDKEERISVANEVQIYELTLAEFPLFIFSTAPKEVREKPYFKYEDQIKGKDGPVKRTWTLQKCAENGYPNESAFATLYELMQIWKEQGFVDRTIRFGSYLNLLRRKGFKGRPGKKDYERLEKDLGSLRGLQIKAQNAFWDSKRQKYVTLDFNLFDGRTSYADEPDATDNRQAEIKASETFHESVINSLFVTDIESEKFHNLPPLAQRLAIYLSKMFKFQQVHKRQVGDLAGQLPIHAKAYKHKKQTLMRACDAIIKANIDLLDSYDFEVITKRPKKENIVLFSKRQRKNGSISGKTHSQYPKEGFEIDSLVEDILSICKDNRSIGFYRKVAYYMPKEDIYQAISEVKELAANNNSGNINLGAVFTSRIKTFADQRKIEFFNK